MGSSLLLLVLLLLVLLLVWFGPAWWPRPLPGVTRGRPLLIGHRGVRGRLPENSLAAFEAAFGAGLDGIEFDVQRSRDGALVLYHDLYLPSGERVTSLTLEALQLEALQRADATMPTLGGLFALARRYPGRLLNLEIKAQGFRAAGLEQEVVRQVRASGLASRVLVSSFNVWSLLKVRLLAPELRTALLFAPKLPLLLPGVLAALLHVDALHPNEGQVDEGLMTRARRRGLMVNVWTVNEAARVRELLALGVDGVMADDPEALLLAAGREPEP
ncbi:MAG: glycerophosphodiester phosphodiesterase [Deinococcota bacterium]|jgi:glycerophosphoryl diester phosphodiesterase|nr:glycerophosphodiester phosphodiesterase [Deinococcota bacterium]